MGIDYPRGIDRRIVYLAPKHDSLAWLNALTNDPATGIPQFQVLAGVAALLSSAALKPGCVYTR